MFILRWLAIVFIWFCLTMASPVLGAALLIPLVMYATWDTWDH